MRPHTQRPVIFVATNDPAFEEVCMDAILDTAHGMRQARHTQGACHVLTEGTPDIALAIIDLDLPLGLSLLHILSGCEPDFPILAVSEYEDLFLRDESILQTAVDYLVKPVQYAALLSKITTICNERRGRKAPSFDQSSTPGRLIAHPTSPENPSFILPVSSSFQAM